jgi:hypothetical protein
MEEVMPDFAINCSWEPPHGGTPEIRRTAARIRIEIGQHLATEVKDIWSQSVQKEIRVSAYPLALWFAANWWRLRWEPRPSTPISADWRMSHEVAAAGYGYLWPTLSLETDGERALAVCSPSPDLSDEPVRYLSNFRHRFGVESFEAGIEEFVALVLHRLDGIPTPLQELWTAVSAERTDPATTERRKLEARLGFDPGEAPTELIGRFFGLLQQAGMQALEELAPVCAGPDPSGTLDAITALAQTAGVEARIELTALPDYTTTAWERGRKLARDVRAAVGWNGKPVSDRDLANVLQISEATLNAFTPLDAATGLAVRESANRSQLHFRRKNRLGRRFEAARFLAGHCLAPKQEPWLPVTDARTSHQKAQRAFAAEFLCPIEALKDYLGSDLAVEQQEEAAEYFHVSTEVVKRQLSNHGLLPAADFDF